MFFTLLVAALVISAVISFVVARIFNKPLRRIFARIIQDEISSAWVRYVTFAIYVVGITGGVRIWQLDRYITPEGPDGQVVELTRTLWNWELFRTLLGALQAITWMLLVVFAFALVAYVIVRGLEHRRASAT
ncbi:MAG: hypothetical protein GTN78_22170 [Gemmatimonadales bacterium]|nr:hypothetical protein [Gemmatimonadales bacterium]NIN10865.1 hypothetical protein [Gemmatimonadales bacterium]NIR02873.1 hypothetical protein [Gemmatimonadales bacterium]NIS66507.1 hypothetical protein [Gemmatimonadales bacterium]